MLSHLVGAAHRADIRRLTELERNNTELKEKVERHQARLRDHITERDPVIRRLEYKLAGHLLAVAHEREDVALPPVIAQLRRLLPYWSGDGPVTNPDRAFQPKYA